MVHDNAYLLYVSTDTEAQNGKFLGMHRHSSVMALNDGAESHNNDLSRFLCMDFAPSSYMCALNNHMSNH